MKKNEINKILNTAELIGVWDEEVGGPGEERLYVAHEEGPEGKVLSQFYLYGSEGIVSLDLMTKDIDMTSLYHGEMVIGINAVTARMWAARFLTDEAYEKGFGKTTSLQKVIDNLSGDDLKEMFFTALDCRDRNYSKETFVSDFTFGWTDVYPGMDNPGLYELLTRMWDLTNPESD